jgi:hypothetical protein
MQQNKKKNIALIVAAAILFLALFDGWEYGFFTLLRFVVFAATAYIAWMAYELKKEWWVWLFGFIAVLFNPFIPIHFARETWVVVDFLTGVFLLASVFFLNLNNDNKSQ